MLPPDSKAPSSGRERHAHYPSCNVQRLIWYEGWPLAPNEAGYPEKLGLASRAARLESAGPVSEAAQAMVIHDFS